jgi:putative MFS transporter
MQGAAFFIAAQFAGLFFGTALFGRIADQFGRRKTFGAALIFYGVSSLALALQDTAAGLHFWRFVTGIGLGVQLVTISTYISELAPSHMRGRAAALSLSIQTLAAPCVALVSWQIVPHAPLGVEGWRWVIGAGVLGILPLLLVYPRVYESPRWLAVKGRLAEADAIVTELEQRIERDTKRRLPTPERSPVVLHQAPERPALAELFSAKLLPRTLMLIGFHICHTIGIYGFLHWGPSFLVEQGISLTESLGYSLAIAAVLPLGPLLALAFADRWERKYQLMACAVTIAAAGLVYANTRVPGIIIASGMTLTLCASILLSNFNVYQAELFPTKIRAMAVGFVYSWSRLAGVMSGFLVAFTLHRWGVIGAFVLISACMLTIVPLIGVFGPKTRNRSLEVISE